MKRFLLIVSVVFVAYGASLNIASASDPCVRVGQKNSMGMAMTVSKVWVMDSTNFMVTSVQKLPFKMGAADTVWFDVCPLVHDGKMHNTQIKYMTDMGAATCNVSMQTQVETCQMVSETNPHPMDINVSKVWVDDSVDFNVMPTRSLPFTVKVGMPVGFQLCLTAIDAAQHTAKVSFASDMGTFTMNAVTMSAAASVAITSTPGENVLKVFPNPANTTLTARLPDGEREGQVVLYSTSGQRVMSATVMNAGSVEIPIGSIAPGVYFLRFESKIGTSSGTCVTISR
jgi:hypothetical protein